MNIYKTIIRWQKYIKSKYLLAVVTSEPKIYFYPTVLVNAVCPPFPLFCDNPLEVWPKTTGPAMLPTPSRLRCLPRRLHMPQRKSLSRYLGCEKRPVGRDTSI
jgi:hypothetical protein